MESLTVDFVQFSGAIAKFLSLKEKLSFKLWGTQFWDYPKTSLFHKIRSLQLLGNFQLFYQFFFWTHSVFGDNNLLPKRKCFNIICDALSGNFSSASFFFKNAQKLKKCPGIEKNNRTFPYILSCCNSTDCYSQNCPEQYFLKNVKYSYLSHFSCCEYQLWHGNCLWEL